MTKEMDKKTRNSVIDLTKFILAIFVLIIHIRPFSGKVAFLIDDCVTRVANPLFFTISSYFLFSTLETERVRSGNAKWNNKRFALYMKRIFILYTIWFILNMPNFMWRLTCDGWRMFPVKLFQTYFLSGPFDTALWFLAALLMGTFLTYFVGKLTKPWIALLVGFLFHTLGILEGDYIVFVERFVWLTKLIEFLREIFVWLANGLTYGMFYCAMGACIAVINIKRKEQMQEEKKKYIIWFSVGTGISFVLYIIECVLIKLNHWGVGFGAQFMMIPFTYFCMQLLLQLQIKTRPVYRFLQKMSVVIYGVHFLVIFAMKDMLAGCKWYMESTTVQFIIVLIIVCGIAAVVVWLSEHTRLHFLKYLY